jgi:hypothetical protein
MTESASPPPIPSNIVAPRTLGLAIASMILGICSIGFSLLTGIPAVVCGIVALNKINKSGGTLGGQGQAIAGLITGIVGCLLIPILAAILLPALAQAREKAHRALCAKNEKQIVLACLMYADDYGYLLPTSFDQLRAGNYLRYSSPDLFRCPSAQDGSAQSYQLVGGGRKQTDIMEPDKTPLIIENPSNHRGAGGNVGYFDCHVLWVPAQQGH